MKTRLLGLCLGLLLVAPTAHAEWGTTTGTTDHKYEIGLDFELPYIVDVAGTSVNSTGNTTMGIHGNYFVAPTWYLGMQFDFGLESTGATDNAIILTPGAGYHFMKGNIIEPIVRLDIPLMLNNGFDYGFSGGFGFALNIGEWVGVEGLKFKYDLTANYMIDSETFSLNLIRTAFAYNW